MKLPDSIGFSRAGAVRALLLPVLLALAFPAWAALGDNLMSVQNDQVHMKGSLRSVAMQRYVMHEIQLPSGGAVREFATVQGSVFGVAWSGPSVPDLQQVLGSYFEQMKQTVQNRRGHGPLVIETPGLVLQQSGHMHSGFYGSAYVPGMLPQGVDTNEIK